MKDGIYFNLPEAEYHALPRLSASEIKEILVSLATYWANSSRSNLTCRRRLEITP